MDTNATNKTKKLIYPELSYIITGVCFNVHNERGRYSRERQYVDDLEKKFSELGRKCVREKQVDRSGNIPDLIIDDKIVMEIKAKDILTKADYYQTQRYLQSSNLKLGLLVNFHQKYLKPQRVIRIDTDVRNSFL